VEEKNKCETLLPNKKIHAVEEYTNENTRLTAEKSEIGIKL